MAKTTTKARVPRCARVYAARDSSDRFTVQVKLTRPELVLPRDLERISELVHELSLELRLMILRAEDRALLRRTQ